MNVASTTRLNGLTLRIEHDPDAECPLMDNGAVIMAVLHRRYTNPAKTIRSIAKASVKTDPDLTDGEVYDFTTIEGVAEFEADNEDDDAAWAVFPLYMYDHSGTVYQPSQGGNPFSCQWDSGRVGIIALKKSDFDPVTKSYFESAKSICETYTDYANGNAYGYVIEDESGDVLDSCWGFIGDSDGYVLTEGKEALTRLAKTHRPTAKIALTVDEAALLHHILGVYTESGRGSPVDVIFADSIVGKIVKAFPDIDEEITGMAEG